MSKVVSALPIRVVVYKRADRGLKQAFYSLPTGLLEVLNYSEDDFSKDVVDWFEKTILRSGSNRNTLYNAIILDPCWHGEDSLLRESEAEFLQKIHKVSSDNVMVSVRAMYAGVRGVDVSLGSESRAEIEFVDDAENFIESVLNLVDTAEFLKTIEAGELPDNVKEFLKSYYSEVSNPEVSDFYKYFTTQSLFRKTIKEVLQDSGIDLLSFAFYFIFSPNSLIAIDSYDETSNKWIRIFTGLISSQNYRISFGNNIEYTISANSLSTFLRNKVELEDSIWSNIFTVYKYESTSERKLSKPLASILTSFFFTSYPNILDYIVDLTKTTFSGFSFKRNANITALFDYALKLANITSGSKLIAPDDLALTYIARTKIVPGAYQAETKSLNPDKEKEPASPEQSNQKSEEKFGFVTPNDSVTEFIIDIGKEIVSRASGLSAEFENSSGELENIPPLLEEYTFSLNKDNDFRSRAFDSLRLRFYLLSKVLKDFNTRYEELSKKELDTYKTSLENSKIEAEKYNLDFNADKKLEMKENLLNSEKTAVSRLIYYFAGICAIYDYIVWNYSPLVFLTPYGSLFSEIYDFDSIPDRYRLTSDYYKHFINSITENLGIDNKVFNDLNNDSIDKFFTERVIGEFKKAMESSKLYNKFTDRIVIHSRSYFLDKVLGRGENTDIISLGEFYKYKQSISSISFDASILAFSEAILSTFSSLMGSKKEEEVLSFITFLLYSATISSNVFSFFSGEKIKVARIIEDISNVLGLLSIETPYGHIILTPIKLYGSGKPKSANDDLTMVMQKFAELVKNEYVFYKDLPYKEDLQKIPLESYRTISKTLNKTSSETTSKTADQTNILTTVERKLPCFSIKPFYGKVNISIKQNIDVAYSNFSIPFGFDFVDLGDMIKNTMFNISAVDPALLFQGAKNTEDISKLNFPTQLVALRSILSMFFEDIFGTKESNNPDSGIAANSENMENFLNSGKTSVRYTIDAQKYYPGVSGADEIDVVIDFQDTYSARMVLGLIHFISSLFNFSFEGQENVGEKKRFVSNFFSALFYYYLVYRAIYVNSSANTIDISITDFKPSNLSVLGNLLFVPQFNYIGIVKNIRVSIRPGNEVRQDIRLSNVIPIALLPYLPPISGSEIIAFASSYLLNIKPISVKFDEFVFLKPKEIAPDFFAFLLGGVYFSRVLGVLSKELGGLSKDYILAGCLKNGMLRIEKNDRVEDIGSVLLQRNEVKLAVRFVYSYEREEIDFSSGETVGKKIYGYDFDTMFKLTPQQLQIGVLVDTLKTYSSYIYLNEFARRHGTSLNADGSIIFYVEDLLDLGTIDGGFYDRAEDLETKDLGKFPVYTLNYDNLPFDQNIFKEIVNQTNIKFAFGKNISGDYLKFIPLIDISLEDLWRAVFTTGGNKVAIDMRDKKNVTYKFFEYIDGTKKNPWCFGFEKPSQMEGKCLFYKLIYDEKIRSNLEAALTAAALIHDARTFNWIFKEFIDNKSIEERDFPEFDSSATLDNNSSTDINFSPVNTETAVD